MATAATAAAAAMAAASTAAASCTRGAPRGRQPRFGVALVRLSRAHAPRARPQPRRRRRPVARRTRRRGARPRHAKPLSGTPRAAATGCHSQPACAALTAAATRVSPRAEVRAARLRHPRHREGAVRGAPRPRPRRCAPRVWAHALRVPVPTRRAPRARRPCSSRRWTTRCCCGAPSWETCGPARAPARNTAAGHRHAAAPQPRRAAPAGRTRTTRLATHRTRPLAPPAPRIRS